ncbi:GntR family transcriptional regulator [Streptomyces sp. NPDC050147]|uniref:GntR family transcriptional regulator n=1 Tax=Streptomyces sp. NPDC050147 TaxID=3155513 RepID=UPI0034143F0B
MTEIQRPGALYQQVAAAVREAILSGEFEPGAPLPSEAQLIERYQVSRPTVRNAIAALRAEGLVTVRHGKGSFVRSEGQPVITFERSVSRARDGQFTTPDAAVTAPAGADRGIDAVVTTSDGVVWGVEVKKFRSRTTKVTGLLLGLAEEEALVCWDRVLFDPTSGAHAMHRTLIPFEVADTVPPLTEASEVSPAETYSILAQAGHKLWWSETVRARMPHPDERTTLRLPDATPILDIARVTHGTDDRPLILEELRTGADRAELAYRITADKGPARRTRA